MAQRSFSSRGPLAGIVGILIVLGLVYMAFKTVSFIFSVLAFVAPVLLIASLFLNKNVVVNYGKWLMDTIKKDTPKGLIYGALSVVGYPFLFAYFFVRSFASSRLKKVVDSKRKEAKDNKEYADYEEVEEDDFLELPDLEDVPQKETLKEDSGYEDLFE